MRSDDIAHYCALLSFFDFISHEACGVVVGDESLSIVSTSSNSSIISIFSFTFSSMRLSSVSVSLRLGELTFCSIEQIWITWGGVDVLDMNVFPFLGPRDFPCHMPLKVYLRLVLCSSFIDDYKLEVSLYSTRKEYIFVAPIVVQVLNWAGMRTASVVFFLGGILARGQSPIQFSEVQWASRSICEGCTLESIKGF